MKSKPTNRYDSKLEASVAVEYPQLTRINSRQKPYTFTVSYVKGYNPDFVLPNGAYLEVKGYHKGIKEWVHMMRLLSIQYPDNNIKIFLEREVYVRRTKLSVILRQYGFDVAIGEVPPEWLDIT
jgi:hypothetical protein